jgi:acetoin utilization deacetylase AcuC-like enzyme
LDTRLSVVYSDRYEIDLPGHIWPTSKYRLIADRIRGSAIAFREPADASWEDLALVHTPEYLGKIRENRLTAADIATLELPWRAELAAGFRLMVGGTIAAATIALDEGLAAHLGGGLHHAFANHGEGFCPFNDVAVAIRVLHRDRRIDRAAVVDCDVHHGNGTAMIFEADASVFTFSIHQQHNYPVFKPRSDLDIGLEDGAGDDRYLSALRGALPRVVSTGPQLLVYLAGADPFEGDRLGGVSVTKEGLLERDRLVVEAARAAGIPMVTVLAGGYALDVEDTVDVHVNTMTIMARARSTTLTED